MKNFILGFTLLLSLTGCDNMSEQIKDINIEIDKRNGEVHLLDDSITKHMNESKWNHWNGEEVKVKEEIIIIDSLRNEVKVVLLQIETLNNKKNRIIEENK